MKKRIHLFILSHALIAFLVMLFISTQVTTSINVLVIHPLMVCAAYTLFLYVIPSGFKVFAISLLTLFLCFLYFSNIIAIQYWNEYISWSFLNINMEVITEELKKFPAYFIVVLLFFVCLVFVVYRYLLSSIVTRTRDFGILLITPMLAIAFVYSTWVISDDMETTWQGEPFFEFVNTRSRQATAQQEIVVAPAGRLLEDVVSSQPNIIFVHADALRADRLGAYGNPRKTSPFLDGLIAKGAQKIPFGFSNCSESMCGFSSVLTSSFSFHSARTGLFEILSDRGYVVSFIGTGSMYESNIGEYIRPRVDNFLRADLDDNYYMHDDRYVLDILTNYPEYAGVPNFFYLRMMSPHNLSRNLEKYRKYHPTRDSLLFMLGGKSLRQTAINDHDNRVVQFDAYLQEIYASLDKKGYLDNAIVVIYGDHGDAMDERGTYGHYQTLYQEEIHVPIVFWSSENVGLDVNTDFFATLMDIPPTVLTQLDQPVPDFFLGSPLQLKKTEKLGYLDSRKDTVGLVYQDKQQLLKLIMDRDDRALVELYDLRNDPGEQANLFRSKPEVAKRMVDERLSIMVRAGNSD